MIRHIHILGASGSGTSTLGEAISQELGYKQLDTDDYYWMKTQPPYTTKRSVDERIEKMKKDMSNHEKWVLTGSLCGWGDVFIPEFDLVIFLRIPKEIRMQRLMDREILRYGQEIQEGKSLHPEHKEFMDWAASYDEGDESIRSLTMHNQWLSKINCKLLRIEEAIEVSEKIKLVKEFLRENN